jgi:hypothetical protein
MSKVSYFQMTSSVDLLGFLGVSASGWRGTRTSNMINDKPRGVALFTHLGSHAALGKAMTHSTLELLV